jgi:hypothetical protein
LSIFPDPIGIFSSSQRFLIDRPPCEPASKLARVSLEFHATQTGGGLMSRSPLISSANPPPQDLLKQKQKEIKEKKERKINSVRGIESIILAMGENMIHRCRIYRPRIVSPA